MSTTLPEIQEFLDQKRIAVVGVSRNPNDFSRVLFREFERRGYDVVPVNPEADEIEGKKCFGHIQEIFPPVDAALLMTAPEVTEGVVRDCAAAGVDRVWMHRGGGQGAVSDEAVDFCNSQGMLLVAGECPLMFLSKTMWFHRAHGFLRKMTGRYPISSN